MIDLQRVAGEIFAAAIDSIDAGEAVRRAVQFNGSQLKIVDAEFDLLARPLAVYAIAVGKAAVPMAAALDEILAGQLVAGVVSAPPTEVLLPDRWRTYAGGHPLPNEASLAAAAAAFELLQQAEAHSPSALVIFLISGGGSAMIEQPRDRRITLAELREANRSLVLCGATIAQINLVRRRISAIKGGGLSRAAPRAHQVTLIVSDTNPQEEANVASGPTLPQPHEAADAAASVIARYDLAARLPGSVLRLIEEPTVQEFAKTPENVVHRHFVLLDNDKAIERAAEAARARGFVVETANDLVEQPINEGCQQLVERLLTMLERHHHHHHPGHPEQVICFVSGGEFACPVKGTGVGGRNAETALRCAIELEKAVPPSSGLQCKAVVLSAGTDGIDGNSPAAGAIASSATLRRARQMNLDAHRFLSESDAYTFFQILGDAVMTGPTGTNVRDLRIMLAQAVSDSVEEQVTA